MSGALESRGGRLSEKQRQFQREAGLGRIVREGTERGLEQCRVLWEDKKRFSDAPRCGTKKEG